MRVGLGLARAFFAINRDEHIFFEALSLHPSERAKFLDFACTDDPEQRGRIAALLASYAAAETFMERLPADHPLLASELRSGTVIGRYTVVRKIGAGGCGEVYLAEQSEPLRRRVALKVIKLGMDTAAVIARFEAERQTLAVMDHPGIAKVFDAGATTSGRPYFVMEYFEGVPITRFADEQKLPMAERLELFARVCLALQHAHQKGVIHRDLKPSNILVALQDGVPLPKIIDFGIAKATQGRGADEPALTAVDQFVGTPAYMSPEQAERVDIDIDTRSDVYSLGVLLYELLTGRPPFDPQSLQQAGLDEMRRIIREVEPPRPSTRLATLSRDDSATVAQARGAAVPRLGSVLQGDLDWIVMRCLEKQRDRRYGTAEELAADVRRHLRHEPVVARPPSVVYRGRKFIARHRLACVSVLAIVLALIAGAVVSLDQAIRARRAERIAREAEHVAVLAKADAQRRQGEAEDLMTFMLGDFRTELQKAGKLGLLDAVGDKASNYFAALNPRDQTDVTLTRHVKALTQIGSIRLDQARFAEAAAAFAEAYTRAAALTTRQPRNADMLFERAQVEYWLGVAARRRNDLGSAREWLTRYRDSAAALVAIEGMTGRAETEWIAGAHNLAVLAFDRGYFSQAEKEFLEKRRLMAAQQARLPNDAELKFRFADLAGWLGLTSEAEGRYGDALEHFTGMSGQLDELLRSDPNVAKWKLKQATCRLYQASALTLLGRRAEAGEILRAAGDLYAGLTNADSANQQWRFFHQLVQLEQASQLLAAERPQEALAVLAPARTALEEMVAKEPAAMSYTSHLAAAWLLQARALLDLKSPDALAAAQQSLRLAEPLLSDEQINLAALHTVAQARLIAGRIAQASGQEVAAREHGRAVIALLTPRLDRAPNAWRLLEPLALAHALLGDSAAARPFVERLRGFDFHVRDPFAAPLLGLPR